jgi:hypothetical protein
MKIDLTKSKACSKSLRMPHQQDAVDSLNKYFNIDNPNRGQSGLLSMPTGARVIIVTGCIKALIPRVSETFIKKLMHYLE